MKMNVVVIAVAMSLVLMLTMIDTAMTARIYMVLNTTYTTTGVYPDWFIEWLNTEYLPEHMEE